VTCFKADSLTDLYFTQPLEDFGVVSVQDEKLISSPTTSWHIVLPSSQATEEAASRARTCKKLSKG